MDPPQANTNRTVRVRNRPTCTCLTHLTTKLLHLNIYSVVQKRLTRGASDIAIGYLRASTDEQHLGPEAQRQAIERWAAAQGIRVAAWHVDQGISGGAALDRRPALLAAIDSVGVHGAGILVVAKRDRLARDVVLAAMIEQLTGRHGARVISAAGEGTDSDELDPSAQLMRRLVDAFAEYERALIRARTCAALGVKKGRNERVGTVPFGFCVAADGRQLVPDPGEQATIERARSLSAMGLSQRAIASALAAEGITGRSGRGLSQVQIFRLLRGSARPEAA
jgi:site-specific DNA recombinase